MKDNLQIRFTLADVAGVKKGLYYVAQKSGGGSVAAVENTGRGYCQL